MNICLLERDEIPLIWQIDRREVIDNIYYLREGKLVFESEHYDMQGWPPGEAEHYTPILLDCYDRADVLGRLRMCWSAHLFWKTTSSVPRHAATQNLHVSAMPRQGVGGRFNIAVEKPALGQKIYFRNTSEPVNYYMRRVVTSNRDRPELLRSSRRHHQIFTVLPSVPHAEQVV
jgi:hypothetical protein